MKIIKAPLLFTVLLILPMANCFADSNAAEGKPTSVRWEKLAGAGSRTWNPVSCTADGSVLVASADTRICISFDSGKTWINKSIDPGVYPSHATITAKGNRIFVSNNRLIYSSADGGKTWSNSIVDGSHFISDIFASADGKIAYSVDFFFESENTSNTTRAIFKSIDSGQTWRELDLSSHGKFLGVTGDQTGNVLLAAFRAADSSVVFRLSQDAGLTWEVIESLPKSEWDGIYCSPDGMHFYASIGNTVFYSKDSGKSWNRTEIPGVEYLNSISSSANGRVVAVSEHKGFIWLSFDGGATWQPQKEFESKYWRNVVVDASGKQVVACSDGYIWRGKID